MEPVQIFGVILMIFSIFAFVVGTYLCYNRYIGGFFIVIAAVVLFFASIVFIAPAQRPHRIICNDRIYEPVYVQVDRSNYEFNWDGQDYSVPISSCELFALEEESE